MKRYRLCNPFPSIEKEGSLSYGGNQNWSSSKTIRKCGCGVIAGTDLLLYLDLNKQRCRTKFFEEVQDSNGIIEREQYLKYVHKMRRDYLPLIPHFGMPGWVLVVGLNVYLTKYHTGLKASWGFGRKKLWNRMSAMLSHDIPVILSIGPNLPFFWKKEKLNLYQKNSMGSYLSSNKVSAHFVTVTEMDEEWMRVSSWGKEYYINKKEYISYMTKYSNALFCNVCYIRKQK